MCVLLQTLTIGICSNYLLSYKEFLLVNVLEYILFRSWRDGSVAERELFVLLEDQSLVPSIPVLATHSPL